MNSFGLWYKLLNKTDAKIPEIDFHVNMWDFPKERKKDNYFVDFGIMIQNFYDIESLKILFPFSFNEDELTDLSYVINTEEIQLIFNDSNYAYSKAGDSIYSMMQKPNETVTFLPVKMATKGAFIKDIKLNHPEGENNKNVTFMDIDFTTYTKLPTGTTAVYFRFRLKTPTLRDLMNRTLKEKNYYLESAFEEREIVDFKLNNVRNISNHLLKIATDKDFKLAKFNSIHIFLMVPSYYEVTIWDNFSECRSLEENKWGNYLHENAHLLIKQPSISAYHWKKKAPKNGAEKAFIDEFSQLFKLAHKATNKTMILIYCLIVVGLGAAGSGLFELIKYLLSLIT